MTVGDVHPASFRDPCGFVFSRDGGLYRAVTARGLPSYRAFMESGLYDALTSQGLLVPHREVTLPVTGAAKILQPERLPFISYPHEWSFSQLQDAALLILTMQALAVRHGESLKDATPTNVQFWHGRPVLVDTLSFEPYRERPWVAYRQFCETFLAPLAMMAYRSADYNRHLLTDLAGLRLGEVSRLLPLRTRLRPGLLSHIHLHAWAQRRLEAAGASLASSRRGLRQARIQHLALLDQLTDVITSLTLFRARTSFDRYYEDCRHYGEAAERFKRQQIEAWVRGRAYHTAADLGANNGTYARILTAAGIWTLALDANPYCVDENYRTSRREGDEGMMPLVTDLTNLSGGAGWDARERAPLFERIHPELLMALGLIHHLRITAGISMDFLAGFFSGKSTDLVLEFVPKSDPMVHHLLRAREDVFDDYDEPSFEAAFGRTFRILEKARVPETSRTLYLLRRRTA